MLRFDSEIYSDAEFNLDTAEVELVDPGLAVILEEFHRVSEGLASIESGQHVSLEFVVHVLRKRKTRLQGDIRALLDAAVLGNSGA